MLLFKQYMLVGGMPMSIVAFLEGRKDFGKADLEKRDILALYRNDIMKIQAQYRSKVLAIFDQIPGLLSRHEKRVVFNRIATGSSADQAAASIPLLLAVDEEGGKVTRIGGRAGFDVPVFSNMWEIGAQPCTISAPA